MCSINLNDRTFIDEDGAICTITNMMDAWGEETDELDMVRVIVARRADDQWLTVSLEDFEASTVQ